MIALLKTYPDGIMDKPDKVKALTIDSWLGGLPKDGQQTRSEYFIEGTEPKDVSPAYKKLKISKSNGKLANDIEIKSGNYDEKDCVVLIENDPISTDGKNRWQEGIDAWRKEMTDDKFHCPTDISDNNSENVLVSIKSPSDKTTVNGNSINVKVKITTLNSLKNVKIFINNNEVKNYNEDKREIDETFSGYSDGTYELKVRAVNDKDKSGESMIKFGLNKPWDYAAPTSGPTNTPQLIPTSSSSSESSQSSSSS